MRMKNQLEEFDRIWQQNRSLLAKGFVETVRENSIFASLVCKIDPALYEVFEEIREALGNICRKQFIYGNENLHFTLVGLGTYPSVSTQMAKIINICRDVVSKFHAFNVELSGLNIFPDTVIVQVLDNEGKFSSLVQHINQKLLYENIIKLENIGLHNHIWWVTLLRFISNDVETGELLRLLEKMHTLYIGRMKVSEFEIVKTDKFYRSDITEVIERLKLLE